MTVQRICTCEVDTARPDESVQTAAQRMHDRNVGTLVVVDGESHPIGIITDRDLTVRVLAAGADPYTTKVGDVMTASPRAIPQTTPIEDALATMRSTTCRRLPVVDAKGRLFGLLTLDDVLSLLAEEFSHISRLLNAESPDALKEWAIAKWKTPIKAPTESVATKA